jgi:hypothetical protein
MNSRFHTSLLVCAPLLTIFTGCAATVPVKSFNEVQLKLQQTQEQLKKLEVELAAQQQANKNLQQQIAEVRNIKGDPTEELIVPVKIQLERMSGGYDTDGKTGDDGIVLYIQPIDRDGHVVKASGTLKITLYDLAAPINQNVIAEYNFDAKTTRSLWYGRLWTSHYTVKCPWPEGKPPAHNKITANVIFTDQLTGKPMEAQQVFEIKMPPVRSAASTK